MINSQFLIFIEFPMNHLLKIGHYKMKIRHLETALNFK